MNFIKSHILSSNNIVHLPLDIQKTRLGDIFSQQRCALFVTDERKFADDLALSGIMTIWSAIGPEFKFYKNILTQPAKAEQLKLAIIPNAGEEVYVRHASDALAKGPLMRRLKMQKTKDLVISGMETPWCITNTLETGVKNFRCHVIYDVLAAPTAAPTDDENPEWHRNTLLENKNLAAHAGTSLFFYTRQEFLQGLQENPPPPQGATANLGRWIAQLAAR